MSSQQAVTGVGSGRGDYETPPDLFKAIAARVGGFTLDAAANHANTKVPGYYCTETGTYLHGTLTYEETGLTHPWYRQRVWLNPPFTLGKLEPFMAKCAAERNEAACIVALIPVATDTNWWHEYVRPYATIHYLRGRVKFIAGADCCVLPKEAHGKEMPEPRHGWQRIGEPVGSPPGAVCIAEFLPDWLNGGKR